MFSSHPCRQVVFLFAGQYHQHFAIKELTHYRLRSKTIRILVCILLMLPVVAVFGQLTPESKSNVRFNEKSPSMSAVQIINVQIMNGPGSEYAPTYYKDGLMMISNSSQYKTNRDDFSVSYFAPFDALGSLGEPSKFEFVPNVSEGPMCFSRDFKTVYASHLTDFSHTRHVGKNGKSHFKVYEMRTNSTEWSNPVELPFNSAEYNCMHPSLSPDGKKMYFASDMPGGFGDYDLYVVDRDSINGWGKPINLGPSINTEKKELYPFISFSGVLFFSSDGRSNGFGGLDLYYVNQPLNNVEEVTNMNEPFNTSYNDQSFIIDPNGKTGFFSSDRPYGFGKYDIYAFDIQPGIIAASEPKRVQIKVINAKTGEPLAGATIKILTSKDDAFLSKYINDLIYESDNNIEFKSNRLSRTDLFTNVDGFATAEFALNRSYIISVTCNKFRYSNKIYTTLPGASEIIQFALSAEQPCFRASGMVTTEKYLKRISGAVITFINRSDNEETTIYTNLNGEYDVCLPREGEYMAQIKCDGFRSQGLLITATSDQNVFNYTELLPIEKTEENDLASGLVSKNDLQIYQLNTLDKIRFITEKDTLSERIVQYLDKIVSWMRENPEGEIDLIVHTDSRGEAVVNFKLSEQVAQNAKTYLISKGIDKDRIHASGNGSRQLRNRCTVGVDCTEEEHLENDRIEIKLKK